MSLTVQQLRNYYDSYNEIDFLQAMEITITVAPSRCKDMQNIKNNIMKLASNRLKRIPGIYAFILTRENCKSGWPHVHGVAWFPAHNNNAQTLFGGRLLTENKIEKRNEIIIKTMYLYNELGKSQVDFLRTEPYKDQKGAEWNDWFDYIVKDQHVPWRTPNCHWKTDQLDILFKPVFTDAFED